MIIPEEKFLTKKIINSRSHFNSDIYIIYLLKVCDVPTDSVNWKILGTTEKTLLEFIPTKCLLSSYLPFVNK